MKNGLEINVVYNNIQNTIINFTVNIQMKNIFWRFNMFKNLYVLKFCTKYKVCSNSNSPYCMLIDSENTLSLSIENKLR